MNSFVINTNISEAKVLNIQKKCLTLFEYDGMNEVYYSPDGRMCLKLEWKGEQRGGPHLFSANLFEVDSQKRIGKCIRNFKDLLIFKRDFAALGGYGLDSAFWSGNPWSSDSKFVVMIELNINKTMSKLCIFDTERLALLSIKESKGIMAHRMWSPDNLYYLFRDLENWYLYSVTSQNIDAVHESKKSFQHCYIDESSKHIVILTESLIVKAIDLYSRETVQQSIKEFLRPNEKADYSIWDPFDDSMIVGVNLYKLEERIYAKCKRWFSIKLRGDS